jgi:hypothetical protein
LILVLCGWLALSLAFGAWRRPGSRQAAQHEIWGGDDAIKVWPVR